MITNNVRAPDMILRELQQKLPGSVFSMTTSGFPIVHYRQHRILFKQRHNRFELYYGHRDSGATTPMIFGDETAVLLHFDSVAKDRAQLILAPKCPHCGSISMLHDREFIYGPGTSHGKMYVCVNYPACNTYVGANADTYEPLGTLADEALRSLRRRAHEVFDPLWKGKPTTRRTVAYQCAAHVLGLAQFHIGHADAKQCNDLVDKIGDVAALLQERVSLVKFPVGTGGAEAGETLSLF